MSFIGEYSLWFLILCLLLGTGYAFLLYYKNRNVDFEKKSLWIMAVIRGLVISMIAFLLLGPMLKMVVKKSDKPLVLVAADNTRSIILNKDSSYYRTEYLERLNSLVETMARDCDIETFLLEEKDYPFSSGKEKIVLDFSGKSTNLSSVFDKVEQLYGNRDVAALVLLSDGIYNTGANPLYKAEKLPFPVYTVGLGDVELQTDMFISGISHNKQSYKGNYFPVEIKIAANKLVGHEAELNVFEGEDVLFTKKIKITTNQYAETIRLSIEAKEKGMHRYRVELSETEGEITRENNRTSFFVEVMDTREKIAMIYNSPHPDISAIKEAIDLIDHYQLDIFSFQEMAINPEDYALIILHQLPSNNHIAQNLLNRIFSSRISSLFILGEQSALNHFNALNTGLNITHQKGLYNDVLPVYNENFTSFTFSEEARKMLAYFPPSRTFFGEYKQTVSSNVFLYQKINGMKTDYPLLLFNDVNGAKTGVFTASGLWKWRVYNYLQAGNQDAFNEIVHKTIQFLSVKSDRSFFRVDAPRVFNENVEVEFFAELYNDSYELVNEPDIVMTLSDNKNREYTYRFSRQDKAYALNVGELPVGEYDWKATVAYGTKSYTKSGYFTVTELLMEAVNLVADHDLLKMISQHTGGEFFDVEKMNDIVKKIENNENIKPRVSYEKRYSLLLNSWVYFLLIVLLLGVEWFSRKWGGGY